MPHDPRVDEAIAAAPPFARPILAHLRALVHAACPETDETIKWGRPFFTAHRRPLCFMAAFKAHAAFGFWRGAATGRETEGSGQFGRLTSLADLPPDEELTRLVREAAEAASEARAPAPRRAARPEAEVPVDLTAALAANAAAAACWARLPPSHRREYVDWITGAKKAETRERRIGKAVAMLAEGKDLNGAYR